MNDSRFARFSTETSERGRIFNKKGKLKMDVPTDLYPVAFTRFCTAAEAFAMTLTDHLQRRFAFRYLTYLQEIAQKVEPSKPTAVTGRPACRLICMELDRLFMTHLYKPDAKPDVASAA